MEFDEFVTLARATALLHPDGDVDPDLIEALRRLVARERRGSSSAAARPTRQPADAMQGQESADKAQEVHKAVQSDPLFATSRQPAAPKPTDTAQKKRDTGDQLFAIASELAVISGQASLVVEQQGSASQESQGERAPAETGTSAPPVDDLFPAGRVRAIMREMATVSTPSGRPDLEAAVKLISSGRPIRRMPQMLTSALPYSLLWLFEAGPSMLPFSRDKQQLARTTIRLLGEDRVRIADFIADPVKGTRSRGQVIWQPLRWPSRHSAIVVVSDLGIGGSQTTDVHSEQVWVAFLEEAERHDVSTVLLNPYEQDRWPPVSAGFDTALTWDTVTGVQALRHTRRLGKGS